MGGKFLNRLIKLYTYGIHKKIFYPFSLLFFVLIVSLMMVISAITAESLMKNTYENIKGLVYHVNYSIDTAVSTMERVSMNLADNSEMNIYLNNESNQFDRYKIQMKLLSTVGYLGELYPYGEIDLFLLEQHYTVSSNSTHDTIDFTQYEDRIKQWYEVLINSQKDMLLLESYVSPGRAAAAKKIAVARKYYSNSGEVLGFTIFSLSDSYFNNLLNNSKFYERSFEAGNSDLQSTRQYMMVTDEEGNIIYLSDESLRDSLKGREAEIRIVSSSEDYNHLIKINGSNYVVTSFTSPKTGLSVISLNSDKSIRENVNRINRTIYALVVLFILIMLMVSNIISRKITGRIKKLSAVMKKAEIKNDVVYVDIPGNDEISELGHSFNVMMKKFVENQMLRNEAEISALQQQINPHFLYNTLGVVNSISQVYGCDEITTISEKLSDMFRYSINRDFHEFVKVRDEITHIENYLSIQQIRFGDKFNVLYEINSEMLDNRIVKFVLQPLVENAIYHGLEKKPGKGLLKIKACIIGDDMCFEIIDNGVGMEAADVRNLRDYLNTSYQREKGTQRNSIGLWNVNSRIRLLYGKKYGIDIRSMPGEGTTAVLRVPVIQ